MTLVSPRAEFALPLPGRGPLALGARTLVMGVVNVTPDSFSDGGATLDPGRAADHALRLEAEGADLIDVGAESTRPGAAAVPADEELARLRPVLRRLRGVLRVPLSIDTYKAAVAADALAEGAAIVNDISALEYDPGLGAVVASAGAALVLMHTRGRSSAMYAEAHYDDVAAEVTGELAARVARARDAGVPADRIVVDPGLGFAKQAGHNLSLLAHLPALAALGRPLLVGPSRKSFLTQATGPRPAADRDWATAAAVTAAVLGGAHIVRVHRVAELVEVVRVADAIRAAWHAAGRPGPAVRS